jgi:NADH-quinone oxidoreductase subunit N
VNPNPAEVLADSLWLVLPEALVGLAACVVFLGGTFRTGRGVWAVVSLAALAGAAVLLWAAPARTADAAVLLSPLLHDRLSLLVQIVALAAGALLVLLSYNEVPGSRSADYHACLLVTVAGLSLVGSANDLVVLFLALELISLPTYVLLYLPRRDRPAQEAAMKYFLLSAFSSALLLFGFSYLYGLAGTTNVSALLQALMAQPAEATARPLVLPLTAPVALVMVVGGLSFKTAAVPFHFYAPDVYQGGPTAAIALVAFVPKAAGIVALVRVLGYLWVGPLVPPGLALGLQVPFLFWLLAAMTMTLGNVLALLQDNLKRIIAYSGIANAGYLLIGLAVAPSLPLSLPAGDGTAPPAGFGGVEAVLFYLIAYGAMTLGFLGVLSLLSTTARRVETVEDLAGLSRSHPGVALLMTLFLFSLIGVPLTAGFAGKLLLFFGAMAVPAADNAWLYRLLALIAVLNTAIAAWYYLRLVAVMYLRNPIKPLEPRRPWPVLAGLWLCALLTLGLGIYPWPLVEEAARASRPVEFPLSEAGAERP